MREEYQHTEKRSTKSLREFMADESGDGVITYSLFASIMAAAVIAASTHLGGDFKQAWGNLGTKLRSSFP